MSAGGMGRALCLVTVSLWLSACGDDNAPPTLNVPRAKVTFANNSSSRTPLQEVIQASILNNAEGPVFIGVVYSQNGLDTVTYDTSANPFPIFIRPKPPATVDAKTVLDTLVISACEDAECTRHITGSPQTVEVSYTVTPIRGWFKADPAVLGFTSELGGSPPPGRQFLSLLDISSSNWKASTSQSWIKIVGSDQGSTPGGLSVEVDPSGLDAGLYVGSVQVTNTTRGELLEVPVTLTVTASLSTTPSSLALGGSDGTDLSAQPLALHVATGSGYWTATIDTGSGPQWLKLSSTYGAVSSTPSSLMVSVDTTGLQRDTTYSASVAFTAFVEGRTLTRTVPVTLRLAAHKLWVADHGVGLVSTPSIARLSHTVRILDSWKQSTTPWTASSNQPWLSVPASGTGNSLLLTANPAGLAPNTLHLATVSFGCSDSAVVCNESIQVGLWVGSSSPNGQDALPLSYRVVETDPIRPYAYVHDGGNTLSVYNLYTAGLVTQVTGLGGALGPMTISNDGSTLYVVETATRRIVPVDLSTLTAGSPWSEDVGTPAEIVYARPNGHGLVLTSQGKIYEATTGAAVSSVGGSIAPGLEAIGVGLEGSLFCGLDVNKSPYSLFCYGLRVADLANAPVTLSARNTSGAFSFDGKDVAISHDGSRVYVAANTPYTFTVYDGQTLSVLNDLAANAELKAVEVGPDDRLYGAARPFFDPVDTWVYDSAGRYVKSYLLATRDQSIRDRQLKVSGDGKRFVVLTHAPSLKFVTSP
ncbi:MAG: hypothetical protein JXB05_34235 [Myxococcaceae bacterium]|nr:hypothetical protein [Myxococcaceae bacterium]